MTNTALLDLPLIDAAQSQKHVTHNEALLVLDSCVQLAVFSRTLASPPGAPTEGDRYLVPAGASGAFSGQAGLIAVWRSGAWIFLFPRAGWLLHVADENRLLLFDGAAWGDPKFGLSEVQNLALLGLGTTADLNNPLSVKADAALLTAKSTGEGGTGDLRVSLNKSTTANTVSQLYQDNYSGRAETGLTGDDNFHIKVSADGATWHEALNISAGTGVVSFPSGTSLPAGGGLSGFRNRLINGNFAANQRGYVTGTVTSVANQYTLDRWRVVVPGQSISWTASGIDNVVTAPEGGMEQVIEGLNIEGGAYTLSWVGSAAATLNGVAVANGSQVTLPAGANAIMRFTGGTVSQAQLEPGSVPTSFERRPYGLELLLCQRYFQIVGAGWGGYYASNAAKIFAPLAIAMRAIPSASLISGTSVRINIPGNPDATIAAPNIVPLDVQTISVYGSSSFTTAIGNVALLYSGQLQASAEL